MGAKSFNNRTRGLSENAAQFSKNLSTLGDLVELDYNTLVRATIFNLWKGVIQKTPVDTGRAKANWQIGTKATDEVKPEGFGAGFSGVRAIPKGIEEAATIFIFNNLEYIDVLEFGGFPEGGTEKTANGFSRQAPAGMVAVTLAEVTKFLELEAKKLGYIK